VKIYIAAPYPIRDLAIELMHHVEGLGHKVTSRWLKSPDELTDEHARKDLEDVDAADLLLFWQPKEWCEKGTGGRHVEFGYALARNKVIILVGYRSNIFHYLDRVLVVKDLETLYRLWS
jgi:hypothetical protein